MVRFSVIIEVCEDTVKAGFGLDSLDEAIDSKLNWLHDSGMAVETWDYIDRPSRF